MKFEQQYVPCERNGKEYVCMCVSIVRLILISGKIVKQMSGSLASGTHCIKFQLLYIFAVIKKTYP